MVSRKLPKYLRTRRTAAGLTLRELARKSAIPHTTLFNLERGMTDATIPQLERIAKVYGQDIIAFLGNLLALPVESRRASLLREFTSLGEKQQA